MLPNDTVKSAEDFFKFIQEKTDDPKSVFQSPASSRKYYLVGTKGNARLYMNVDLEPSKFKDKNIVAIVLRFFQYGGKPDAFVPPLNVRAKGYDIFRLSKLSFAFINQGDPREFFEAWSEQNVTDQLIVWAKGVCQVASATVVSDEVLKAIIELPCPPLPVPENKENLFSLDLMQDEESSTESVETNEDSYDEEEPEDQGEYSTDDGEDSEDNGFN